MSVPTVCTSISARCDAADYLKKYAHLLKWNDNRETILDFGCGDGYVTRQVLYPYVENYIEVLKAVDILETVVEYAKKNNKAEKIHYEVMDIMGDDKSIKQMEAKFHHIFSFYCTHWIFDQRSLLERFHKLLKPGGQIFVTTVTDSYIHQNFNKHREDETWSKYIPETMGWKVYSENPGQYMKNLLEEVGFDVNFCKDDGTKQILNDYKSFLEAIIYQQTWLNCIPKDMHEEYIQDHIQKAIEYVNENPNTQTGFYNPLIFIASKKS